MTATNSTPITCPVCDAPNTSRSLFCAECGSALKDSDNGDTAALSRPGPAASGSQATAVIDVEDRWQAPEASSPAPTGASTDPAFEEPVTPLATDNPYIGLVHEPPGSSRGFWLGMVATLLMLLVLALWMWAAVLDQGTRDSVGDLFGFLN